MNEAEWQAATDPTPMLEALRATGRASHRRLRLFACACARRLLPSVTEKESSEAVEVAEQFADDEANADTLEAAERSAEDATTAVYGTADAAESPGFYAADAAAWAATKEASTAATFGLQAALGAVNSDAEPGIEQGVLACLLRDIFGNPFRPLPPLAASLLTWRDGLLVRVAEDVYANRVLPGGHFDEGRVAVLADALEDAGCQDAEILGHLRGPGPHVRGCYIMDLLLGKE
jgi:hypothetical protein